jgi:ankyrin repeat protein
MGISKVARKIIGQLAAAAALAAIGAPAYSQAQLYSDSYAFLEAVKDRDGAKVEGLVGEKGALILNTKDRTTGESGIHVVTRERDMTWLNYFVGKGARIDAQDKGGATPLIIAAQIGWLEGAQRLIDRKASIDLANGRGETPLILAVQRRDLAMVRLLLANGANPKRSDRVAGYSALDYAKRDARSAAILKELEMPPTPPKPVAGPGL